MNRVILSGGLTRDPEIRYTQSGKAVASLSLGVNRGYKKAENGQYPQSDYFNIVAWDKTAEFCGKYLTKGRKILVEGRLQTRTYEAQDGSKRHVTEVVSDNIEFMDSKRQDGSGSGYGPSNDFIPRTPESTFNNDDDIIDDRGPNSKNEIDIPF